MSLSNLMGLLQQYENPAAANNTANTERDFEQVYQNAPQSHVASGLAEAFRSNQTPPFAQMLTTLFTNSNGQQQAGILNHLLGSVGSASSAGILGGLLGGDAVQKVPQILGLGGELGAARLFGGGLGCGLALQLRLLDQERGDLPALRLHIGGERRRLAAALGDIPGQFIEAGDIGLKQL